MLYSVQAGKKNLVTFRVPCRLGDVLLGSSKRGIAAVGRNGAASPSRLSVLETPGGHAAKVSIALARVPVDHASLSSLVFGGGLCKPSKHIRVLVLLPAALKPMPRQNADVPVSSS